ncbi:hypothetical protein PENSPDRAFT_222938 [Peniophora sp. CONT]|nr:hypothetical protein PENSPDRAFT_222938 [Peniophora sp. CONT]
MRIQAHHYSRRQDDSLTVPTAAGLGAAQTAAATAAAVNSLLVDADPGATAASVTADLVPGSSAIVVTSTGAAGSTLPTASASHSAAAASSGGKSGLGTGPMIGIIIAAFAGVLLIILVVYFSLRRRWASALDKAQQERQAQPWAKLDEDGNGNDDKWEGMMEKKSATTTRSNTTKSVDTNVHRLSLFRKASSTRSGFEDNKSRLNQFDPSTMPNFATYHPDLAAELANTPVVPPARPFAVTRDTNSERTTGTDSFLSLRLSDSSFAGALVKTVPPPSAAVPALHRWESAEVLTMDSDSMYATTSNADSFSPLAQHAASNPFADDISASQQAELGRTKSGRNPFFGGSNENPFADQRRRSRATSEVTRQSEDAPSLYPYSVDAGVAVPPLVMRRSSTSSVETVRAGPVRPDSSVRPLSNQTGQVGMSGSAGMQGLLAALQDGEQGKRGSYASSYQHTERSSVGSWGGTAM